MKLYRFSPILNKEQLFDAIRYTHFACHKLCNQTFGKLLPNAGNIGIFCHYEDEFERLVAIRKEITEPSDNPDQKYFKLHEPIVIPAQDGVPETTYTHLYIRRPDPYRHHVGDVDFYLEPAKYNTLRQSIVNGEQIKGARIYPRTELDMIELFDPDIDTCSYIISDSVAKKIGLKPQKEAKK
jgi:hypothetical protein